MKLILTILTMTMLCGTVLATEKHKCWQSAIPGMPIGSGKRIGGVWVEKEFKPSKPETVKQAKIRLAIERLEIDAEREAKEAYRQQLMSWILKMIAIASFIVGGYLHLKKIGGNSYGSSLMSVGVALYVWGAVTRWESRHVELVEWSVMALFFGFVVYLVWKWRDEDGTKLKRKFKPPKVTIVEPKENEGFDDRALLKASCPACFGGIVVWREGDKMPEKCNECMKGK